MLGLAGRRDRISSNLVYHAEFGTVGWWRRRHLRKQCSGVNTLHTLLPSIEEADCTRHHFECFEDHVVEVEFDALPVTRIVQDAFDASRRLYEAR